MRVEFDQTEEDVAAAGVALLRHDPTLRRPRRVRRVVAGLLAAVGLLMLALFILNEVATGMVALGLVGFALTVLGFAFWPTAQGDAAEAKQFARRATSGPVGHCLLGPKAFEVTPDALRVKSPYTESAIRWEAIGYVVRDEDYVFLAIPGPAMFAVPRQAFPTDTQFEAFAAAAENAHRAAHPEAAGPGVE